MEIEKIECFKYDGRIYTSLSQLATDLAITELRKDLEANNLSNYFNSSHLFRERDSVFAILDHTIKTYNKIMEMKI